MEWRIPVPLATAKVRLVDGGTILLRRHGNPCGRRLLISHANGLSSDAYFPFWSLLAEQFDIILFDLRGHGASPPGELIDHNVAMMAQDSRRVVRAVDQHFGEKPMIGVFHSVSATVAVLHAIEEDAYAALVLFDPAICPPGIGNTRRDSLRAMGQQMAAQALRRQARFEDWEELAGAYRRSKAFECLRPGVADLLARTTLKRLPGGTGFELCCPPAHEAQMLGRIYEWAIGTNLETLRCPVKVIGGDPLAPFSFLPTVDPDLIVRIGYDFVPETTHFLQLEAPEECARLVTQFLASHLWRRPLEMPWRISVPGLADSVGEKMMVKMSGGEALVKSLAREGVDVVFGIPGIQIYGIVAAIRDEPGIRMVTTRHEQAATYMADGYARASGKPGVALVVPGVGIYNAASGLATAYARSSPVLCLAGQIPRHQMGKNLGAVHEIANQLDVVRPVTKWQRQVLRPRDVPGAVAEAFRQMRSGRPRPVALEIPPDASVEREEVLLRKPFRVPRIVPSPELLREAARVIAQSRLPLIYAGGGVASSDAEATLVELAEATRIPVVTSTGGKGAIPDNHALSYGSCFSPRAERQEMNQLYDVMQSADVVIGIGARFSLGNPAGEKSILVNINIDDAELTRVQANTILLHGDARATIEALLPYLAEAGAGNRPPPSEAVAAARRLIAYYDIQLHEPHYPFLQAIRNGIPEEAFAVWDITQLGFYARTHWRVNHPKTYIDPGYSFNLGYSFPTALGVKVARPDRPVVCIAGDGGFMFNSSELATAVKYGIHTTTVVLRNDSYGNVARDLDEVFGGTYETDLHNPDFVKLAESFGAVGMRAGDPMELETLIPLALEKQAPVIIDVPFADMPIPVAPQVAPLYRLAWTRPQEGLIES